MSYFQSNIRQYELNQIAFQFKIPIVSFKNKEYSYLKEQFLPLPLLLLPNEFGLFQFENNSCFCVMAFELLSLLPNLDSNFGFVSSSIETSCELVAKTLLANALAALNGSALENSLVFVDSLFFANKLFAVFTSLSLAFTKGLLLFASEVPRLFKRHCNIVTAKSMASFKMTLK